MPGDVPRHFDHLPHTEALAVAEVEDQRPGIIELLFEPQRFEGQQVRPRQITDVYVIADAGAVARRIVRAENVDVFGTAESDLQNPGNQMGLGLVRFALVCAGSTSSIEISQAGIAQAVNLM